MRQSFPFLCVLALFSCSSKKQVDLLVYNGTVYTVDSTFSTAQAFVVRDGKIADVGSDADIRDKYEGKETYDAGGKAVYPGFIDGHAHFYSYGEGLQTVDLTGTKSWEEIVEKVRAFGEKNNYGWLIGRGWDQNDWKDKGFPDNELLNKFFPGRPVLLSRIDGHAIIVNQDALDQAGIKPGQTISGGEIVTVNGRLTGVLVDNAMGLIYSKIPPATLQQSNEALLDAQQNCFAAGLTSVVDCGLDYPLVKIIDDLQKKDQLKMRMYVMLSDNEPNYEFLFKSGPIKTDKLNVRSFKVFTDGALGSRGACLLQPYSDKHTSRGFLLSSKAHFQEVAQKIADKGFQMCSHAIGDSANRTILDVYSKVLKGKNDHRWRIEHAQVVEPSDFDKFGQYAIVPSVQPTHATSDMYWAAERLGPARLKGAYAYKELMKQNGWVVLGTDFPVENINPLLTFYASVVRKDARGYPAEGFQPENALTREEALKGMTLWAAMGSFEEKEKGSIEAGKFADFVILDKDIMKAKPEEILSAKVVSTYLGGEKVF